jgi:hypothetical protein
MMHAGKMLQKYHLSKTTNPYFVLGTLYLVLILGTKKGHPKG